MNPDPEFGGRAADRESGLPNPDGRGSLAAPDSRTSFFDYLEAVARRKWLALGVFAAVMVLAVLTTSRTKPSYQAQATMMLTASNQSDILGGSQSVFFPGRPNTGNCITLLRSRSMAERVAKRLPDSMMLSAGALQSMILAKTSADNVVQVAATAPSRAAAIAIANAYVETYQQYDLDMSLLDVAATKKFIKEQIVVIGARLDSSEQSLAEFNAAHGLLTGIDAETQALISQQSALAAQSRQAALDAEVTRADLAYVQSQIEQEGKSMADVEAVSSPLVASLKGTLNQLEVEKTSLIISGFGENSERIKGLDRQIDSTRARLRIEAQVLIARQGLADPVGHLNGLFESALTLNATLATSEARQEALASAISGYDAQLARLPEVTRTAALLTRNVEIGRQQLALFTDRYEQARIQESGRTSSARTLDPAQDAHRIGGPSPSARISLLLVLAIALALGSVWTAEYLDTSVHGQGELERRGYSVLGSIPQLLTAARQRQGEDVTSHLITHTDVESSGAEAFRMLRTALAFATAERMVRTIAVTSPGPSEGKSTIAVNFASVLAQAGSRVLLIDADLRHPMLHTVFKRKKKPGLSDLIIANGNPEEAIFATGLEGLYCLPCGTIPPSPGDLLTLAATRNLLKRLAGEYDYVVIDTPPVLVAADTAIIGSLVDATIMVARVDRTAMEALGHARNAMLGGGAHLTGIVLNDVKRSGRYGRYYYYYYKYHYRYSKHAEATAKDERSETGDRGPGTAGG